MKICPVCDKKITGRWCSDCHRFVTPLEFKSDIHLNESHSRDNDASCEYHNPTYNYSSQSKTESGYENEIYDNLTNVGGRPNFNSKESSDKKYYTSSTTDSKKSTSYKEEKYEKSRKFNHIVRRVMIAYFVIIFINIFYTIASRLDISDVFTHEPEPDIYFDFEPVVDITPLPEITDKLESYEFNQDIIGIYGEPLYIENGSGYTDYFYDYEVIKERGIPCDLLHMNVSIDELKDQLVNIVGNQEYDEWEEIYEEDNCVTDYGNDYISSCFSTCYYMDINELSIYASVDTANGLVHSIDVYGYASDEQSLKILFDISNSFNPGVFADIDGMKAAIKTCSEGTGYTQLEGGINKQTLYVVSDYISIAISPQYN